jgi:hypothetical protein
MRLARTLKSMACAAALMVSSTAFAELLDFEEIIMQGEVQGIGTYTEKGFTFIYTAGPFEPFPTELFAVGRDWQYNTGSIAILANSSNATTTLTRGDGQPFALLAIDLAEMLGEPSVKVAFYGTTTQGETVAQEFVLDGKPGFQRFLFPERFQNLVRVDWQQGDFITNGIHMFDNVLVTTLNPTPSDPPSSKKGKKVKDYCQ